MKCVAIGDNFITPDMMKRGIESYSYLNFDNIEYFFFGLHSRSEMRHIVKVIETGGFETLDLPEGLLDAVEDADVIMCHLCPITKKVLERAKKLKLILCNRGGHENIDVEACTEKNVAVLLNPSHNANAVAEFTVGLILNETRNITRSNIAINNGEWREKYPNTATQIHEMCDLTIGLIGFGAVAQLVYEKLKAFNCRFLISDPFYSGKINKNIAKFVPLEQLLENSDVVSLHARLSRKSILLGEEEFKRMKNTAYFINTARSYMVDYDALAGALKTGEIMGAAIDVFDVEPVTKENNPLVGLDNCTLTNHRGGDTINSYSDSPAMMMKEAQKYFEGDTPKYWLNPTVKR